jgi:hypothetical protein
MLTDMKRRTHSADSNEPRSKFSTNTSTSSLRAHLFKFHLDEWVEECDKRDIKITAAEAKPSVNSYRRQKGQTHSCPGADPGTRKKYSNEAFVDALAEFIVADDQVTMFFLLLLRCGAFTATYTVH